MSKPQESRKATEADQTVDLFAEFTRQFDRRFGSLPSTLPEGRQANGVDVSTAQKR